MTITIIHQQDGMNYTPKVCTIQNGQTHKEILATLRGVDGLIEPGFTYFGCDLKTNKFYYRRGV